MGLKRVIISTIIVLVLVGGFFAWLSLYFTLGDDLVMDLNANQTSFHITNVENAPVRITVSTQGQLFCATTCEMQLLDANGTTLSNETFSLGAGENVSRDFSLAPNRIGAGQNLYSVSVSCRNTRSLLCPTASLERRKTVLLSVNYELASAEQVMKSFLQNYLTNSLENLRATDTSLLQVKAILTANPRLHPGALLADAGRLQEEFGQENIFLEDAKKLWSEELYHQLYDVVRNANVTNTSIAQTTDESDLLKVDLINLPAAHNKLMNALDALRMAVNESAATLNDPSILADANGLVNDTNNLVLLYATDQYEYPALAGNITFLESRLQQFNTLVAARNASILAQGNALFNCTTLNVTACDYTLSEICDQLSNMTNISYYAYCNFTPSLPEVNMTALQPLVLEIPEVASNLNTTLPQSVPQCCVFGECKQCCTGKSCADDPATYPIVFVHGHAFSGFNSPEYSLGGYFTGIQQLLQKDGYIDAGILTPSSTLSEVDAGEWGKSGRPITVRVTYYYNFYKQNGGYVLITQKSENIETYAIRLKETIELVKHHTGKNKVNIVAHSMGGLVVRRYMELFGEDSVNKVILIATPNSGISNKSVGLCPVFGESKECSDMAPSSVFMQKVNDPSVQPHVPISTIRGLGCNTDGQDGDGVVTSDSARLSFAKNYYLRGNCTDAFGVSLHTEILNVDKYPEIYEFIKKEMKG